MADLASTTSGKETNFNAKFVQNIDPKVRRPINRSRVVRLSLRECWWEHLIMITEITMAMMF